MQIIAETAFSHEGDFNYLKEQIHVAKQGHADFVKLQVFLSPEDYYVTGHPALETIGKYIFSKEQWLEAFDLAQSYELKILALPLEPKALYFCLEQQKNIDAIEVHSVCFNDRILLSGLLAYEGLIFIGIGGRTSHEIKNIISFINGHAKNIILQYGFQAFPTNPYEVNLNRLEDYKKQFHCRLGYADHSDFSDNIYLELSSLALGLGCEYFEKHIVLNKGVKRIDFESAVSVDELIELRNKLNSTKKLLGQLNSDSLTENEINYRNREKIPVAKNDLTQGHVISHENIIYKIHTEVNSDFIADTDDLIGKEIKSKLSAEQPFYSNLF